jgi:arsenate reductase
MFFDLFRVLPCVSVANRMPGLYTQTGAKREMTDTITMYHNPRCSKSRATLELLNSGGNEPQLVEYLKEPPTAETLTGILDMLGMEPRDLIRKKEKEYSEAGLDNPDLGREELIAAMVKHPSLIERPIVIANGKAAIGRPPERVLEIL